MQKHVLQVVKTARVYALGEVSKQTNTIWIVCHGYGQLARFFLKKMEPLLNERTVIFAPEGQNRFYLQGFSDRVGASWMTSDDREDDIRDYITYLDECYARLIQPHLHAGVKINVLGFSQGAATVCRWVNNGNVPVNKLVLWAGSFPHDLNFKLNSAVFNRLLLYLVVGEQDEFADLVKAEEHQKHLQELGLPYRFVSFAGKHELHTETLKAIANQ